MWQIGSHSIATVAVVDDDAGSRESLGWLLSDAGLEMHELKGPLSTVNKECAALPKAAHAVICDHNLSARANYATFAGAELVASVTMHGFPAILCTRYAATDILAIRPLLPYIPVLLPPNELREPEELHDALVECVAELAGNILPERKPWRTQVVVEQVDNTDRTFCVSLPAWEIDQVVRLRLEDVPEDLRDDIKIGYRSYAMANIGTDRMDRLYIREWTR